MKKVRRKINSVNRRLREARMFAKAMHSTSHPILAQIVPVRRCNLSCTYCNEFDSTSPPVPLEEMLKRVGLLGRLGATVIVLSGGEPTLHPGLGAIVRAIRQQGALAGLITNGYLLTPERIQEFNAAGLDHAQISIDNLIPDETSKKSLKVLDRKLAWLAEHAEFAVTINTVLGGSSENPQDALHIAERARELGFLSTVGVLHDHNGQAWKLTPEQTAVYERILRFQDSIFSFAHYDRFQQNVIVGEPNEWHCRAGSRYLYICEDGLVHYCSQRRGRPGIPLEQYTQTDLDKEFRRHKPCEPYCTISCVHQTAMLDSFREAPQETLVGILERRTQQDPQFKPPAVLHALQWLFMHSRHRRLFNGVALRLLGARSKRNSG